MKFFKTSNGDFINLQLVQRIHVVRQGSYYQVVFSMPTQYTHSQYSPHSHECKYYHGQFATTEEALNEIKEVILPPSWQ